MTRCVLRASGEPWEFSTRHATAIAAHWAARKAASPALFDGVIHILARWTLVSGAFAGTFLRTDFKSFIYWRDHGYPDPSPRDCFGSALLRSCEGHVLLGRQRAGNINAGLAYPPGGFIDARDVGEDGAIDIDASIGREVREETGLGAAEIEQVPGYRVAFAGSLVSVAVEYRSRMGAHALREHVLRHVAHDPDAELIDALVVRTMADVEADTPEYAKLLLGSVLGNAL